MNNFSQCFPDPRLSGAHSMIPEMPTATCQLCGYTFPISRKEEAQIHGYPPRPYVCPLCHRLMEEAEESIGNEILSRMDPDSLHADHCNTNKTEVMKNERYDEKCEPDEASDDEYETLSRELETDCQGGSSKEGGCNQFQTEAERPLRINVELVMNLRVTVGYAHWYRDTAADLYREAINNGATHQSIMAALEAEKKSVTWMKESGRFIPGIVKWLQKETWREYLTQETPEEDEEWITR